MNQEKMGQFISEQRKEKNLTQKALAERLGVTDKAVSKWERGLSCPDISLLPLLSEQLGISVSELLNGEKNGETAPIAEELVETTLLYADTTKKNRVKNLRLWGEFMLSGSCLIGIIVCFICDMALNNTLIWAGIPIASIIYGWLFLMPLLVRGIKGLRLSLLALTVLIFPYLLMLAFLIGPEVGILQVGIPIAIFSGAFLWAAYYLLRRFRNRYFSAFGFLSLLAFVLTMAVNGTVNQYVGHKIGIDALINGVCLGLTAAILFRIQYIKDKENE